MGNELILSKRKLWDIKGRRVSEIETENGLIISSKGVLNDSPYIEFYYYKDYELCNIVLRYFTKNKVKIEITYDKDRNIIKIVEDAQTKKVIKEYYDNKIISKRITTSKGTIYEQYSYDKELVCIEREDKYYKKISKYKLDDILNILELIIPLDKIPVYSELRDLTTNFLYSVSTLERPGVIKTIKYSPYKQQMLYVEYYMIDDGTYTREYPDGSIENKIITKDIGDPNISIANIESDKSNKIITQRYNSITKLKEITSTTNGTTIKDIISYPNDYIIKMHYEITEDNNLVEALKYINIYKPFKNRFLISQRIIYDKDTITTLEYTNRRSMACIISKSIENIKTGEIKNFKTKFGRNITICIDPEEIKIGESITSVNIDGTVILVKER